MPLNSAPNEKNPPPGDYGTCESCGGPVDEHGVSPMMAEAEEQEGVESPETTDQHARADQMHESAFVNAIKKGR